MDNRSAKLFSAANETGGEAVQWLFTPLLLKNLTFAFDFAFCSHPGVNSEPGFISEPLRCILKPWLECLSQGFLFLCSRIAMIRPLGLLTGKRQSHFACELPLVPRLLKDWKRVPFVYRKRYWVIFVTSSNRWLQGIGCWKLWHLSGEPLEVISGSAGCFAYMRFLFCVVIPSGKCWEIWGWKKLEDFLKPSSSAWGENIRIHSECTCANIGRGKSLPSQVSLDNRANLFMYNVSLTASKCIFLCLSVVW